MQETTALGAAFLAGLGTGIWSSTEELVTTWQLDRRFSAGHRDEAQEVAYQQWLRAVERAKGWAQTH